MADIEVKKREDGDADSGDEGEDVEVEKEQQEPQVSASEDGVKVKLPGGITRSQAKREARRLEEARRQEEIAALKRQVAELQGAFRSQPANVQQPQQPEKDPYREEMRTVRREQEMIAAHLRAGNVQGSEAERLKERFYELEDKKEQMFEERMASRMQAQQPRSQSSGVADLLYAEYPDVVRHPQALQYAQAYWNMKRAEGQTDTIDLAREALTRGAQQFGLRTRAPAISDAQKARYGAVPMQSTSRTSSSNEVTLNKDQQRIARAMYPSLEENEAFATWARNIGSKMGGED